MVNPDPDCYAVEIIFIKFVISTYSHDNSIPSIFVFICYFNNIAENSSAMTVQSSVENPEIQKDLMHGSFSWFGFSKSDVLIFQITKNIEK